MGFHGFGMCSRIFTKLWLFRMSYGKFFNHREGSILITNINPSLMKLLFSHNLWNKSREQISCLHIRWARELFIDCERPCITNVQKKRLNINEYGVTCRKSFQLKWFWSSHTKELYSTESLQHNWTTNEGSIPSD